MSQPFTPGYGQGYNYRKGRWFNRNGTQVGVAGLEDEPMTPQKSTGDTPTTNLQAAAKLRRERGQMNTLKRVKRAGVNSRMRGY